MYTRTSCSFWMIKQTKEAALFAQNFGYVLTFLSFYEPREYVSKTKRSDCVRILKDYKRAPIQNNNIKSSLIKIQCIVQIWIYFNQTFRQYCLKVLNIHYYMKTAILVRVCIILEKEPCEKLLLQIENPTLLDRIESRNNPQQ